MCFSVCATTKYFMDTFVLLNSTFTQQPEVCAKQGTVSFV